MARVRAQAGEGRIGCIFWLLVLAAVIVVAWEWVPVRINTAEFADYMDEQAKFAQNASPAVLKRRLIERARALELPIEPDDCTVEKPGDRIRMRCVYEIELEYPGYTYVWKFDEQIDEPLFIF
jgi:hypothetical protein